MERKGTQSLRRFCQLVLACVVVAAVVVGTKAQADTTRIEDENSYLSFMHVPPVWTPFQFEYACEYLTVMYGADCSMVRPPTVVTSRIVSDDYYGLHIPRELFIFINKRLWLHDRPKWATSVVHETVHYILDFSTNVKVTRCQSEEWARRAHHSYEGTTYDDSWRESYKCT